MMISNIKLDTKLPNENYLLKLELGDGTSQFLEVTDEIAANLGVITEQSNVWDGLQVLDGVPFLRLNNDIDLRMGDAHKQQESKTVNVYKIVTPKELNLKTMVNPPIPRGRPRKKPVDQTVKDLPKPTIEPPKVAKETRTRSGRLTKPPRHIERDFQFMHNADEDFKPKEGNTPNVKVLSKDEPVSQSEIQPLLYLSSHSRKRKISSQFRCKICKKVYLGRMRMIKHFRKYPDHGQIPKCFKKDYCTMWNTLLGTMQKSKAGTKGRTMCEELRSLLLNVKSLAKCLFTSVAEGDQQSFFVDEELAVVFRVQSGYYCMKEKELNNDMCLYLDDYNEENANTSKKDSIEVNVQTDDTFQPNVLGHGEQILENNMRLLDYGVDLDKNVFNNGVDTSFHLTNGDFGNNQSHIHADNCEIVGDMGLAISDTHVSNFPMNIDTGTNVINISKGNNCEYRNLNSSTNIVSENNMAGIEYPTQELDFQLNNFQNLNHELINALDIDGANFNVPQKAVFNIDDVEEHCSPKVTLQDDIQAKDAEDLKKGGLYEIDKHINEFLPEDLILENVDTGQVSRYCCSHLLDGNSNSDEMISVDQFVNERLKLIEPDIEMQNSTLNIDLPPLDIFQFHTS